MKWFLPFVLALMLSGCIATTSYVDAKCNQTEAKAKKYAHLIGAQAEEVREQIVGADSDTAKGAVAVSNWHFKKHAEIEVPPDPSAMMGWGGILTTLLAVLGAVGLGGGTVGLKLRSVAKQLSEKDEEYSNAVNDKNAHMSKVKSLESKVSRLETDLEDMVEESAELRELRSKHEKAIELMKKYLKENDPTIWENAKSILTGRA